MCLADDADYDLMMRTHCRPVAAWPHRCDDCGRTIPTGERYDLTEWAEWWPADQVDETLALPVDHRDRRWMEEAGVRRGLRTRPFLFERTWSDDYEVVFRPGTEQTTVVCDHCLAAAGWLTYVCSGYINGCVVEDLDEHWAEGDGGDWYRCVAFGRLILSAGGRPNRQGYADLPRVQPWHRLDGTLIPVETVERWVAEAVASYQRKADESLAELIAGKAA